MTSKLQPIDQGVIKKLKDHYCKKIMQRHLRKLELDEAIGDVNLLDCIHMFYNSWEAVSTSTISNCFRRSGFRKPAFNKFKHIHIKKYSYTYTYITFFSIIQK